MSECTDRATRRELRRAMGESGVSVIEKANVVILGHEHALAQQGKTLDALTRASVADGKRITGLTDERRRDAAYLETFLLMSFWERLRWIVRGRWNRPERARG